MRPIIKSLLIAFGLYVLFMLFGFLTTSPEARGWFLILILPYLAGFLIIGWLIGFIIEKIKRYKSKRKSYVGIVGLICAIVGLLSSFALPKQINYFIFGSPNAFYWSFWAFTIGAFITFIIELIVRNVKSK